MTSACNAILGIEDRPPRPDSAVVDDSGGTSAYAREVLADAPLLYLRFGETSGLTAVDEMHRFDGTYPPTGIAHVPGALIGDSNLALRLGGASKVVMPSGADFVGLAAFSAEMWVNHDPTTVDYPFIIDHQAYPRQGWNLIAGAGLETDRWTDVGHISVGVPIFAASEWHHVVVTFDGKTITLWVDGSVVASQPSAITLQPVPDGWTIGGQNCDCHGTFFSGVLDELAVYDHALGGDRIATHIRAAGR